MLLSAASLIVILVLVIRASSVKPLGSTGCSMKFEGGRCWRYCTGSSGDWCYTSSTCNSDYSEECATKTECSQINCSGAAEGCVETCSTNTSSDSKYYTKPLGSTGCSEKWVGGYCWRYCEGSTGDWCYTRSSCKEHREGCADVEACGARNCQGADPGCVVSCPFTPANTTQIESFESQKDFIYWLQIIGPITVIVILLLVSFILWKNLYLAKRQLRNMTRAEEDEWRNGCLEKAQNYTQLQNVAMYLPFNNEYEIPKEILKIGDDLLGSGAYGSVYKGYLPLNKTIVAIKTVNSNAQYSYFKALLDEIKMMVFIGNHQHVLHFIGACTENIRKNEVFVVLEFCDNGDLLSYLRKHKDQFNNLVSTNDNDNGNSIDLSNGYKNLSTQHLSTMDLIRFTKEALEGAEYLALKKVIHGDLAARNLLLTKDLTIKIADFGLARQLALNDEYIKQSDQKIPYRWMAMEVLLERKYTTQSDIWSFGITMWEIFTLGEIPFPGLACDRAFITMLENGFRPNCPKLTTSEIYEFMLQCWHPQPSQRKTFTELTSLFQEIIDPGNNGTNVYTNQNRQLVNYNYYTDSNLQLVNTSTI